MTGLLVLLIGAFIGLIGFLIYYNNKDRRFLQGRTRDSLSPSVKEELEEEIEDSKRRQQLFRQSLENAAKLAKSQDNSLTSND